MFGIEAVLLRSPSQQFTGDVEKYGLFILWWFLHHPARCWIRVVTGDGPALIPRQGWSPPLPGKRDAAVGCFRPRASPACGRSASLPFADTLNPALRQLPWPGGFSPVVCRHRYGVVLVVEPALPSRDRPGHGTRAFLFVLGFCCSDHLQFLVTLCPALAPGSRGPPGNHPGVGVTASCNSEGASSRPREEFGRGTCLFSPRAGLSKEAVGVAVLRSRIGGLPAAPPAVGEHRWGARLSVSSPSPSLQVRGGAQPRGPEAGRAAVSAGPEALLRGANRPGRRRAV